MTTPVTTQDARFSDPAAAATSWDATRRVLETAELFWISTVRADFQVRDGAFQRTGGEAPAPVFAVTPAEVLAFAKGTFSHTRHHC